MIPRPRIIEDVDRALRRSRIVALIGPRQSGKTTVARQVVPANSINYFDLEDPSSLARLNEPMIALSPLMEIVVIDEIQRDPALFQVLRVLADREQTPAKFLILGSASPGLVRQSSETLAGRVENITLSGFSLDEVGTGYQDTHWLRGGFPPSFLAQSDEDSYVWRRNFIQTFVERDVPVLGLEIPPTTLLRLWTMIAHYHGGVWSTSEFAKSLGIDGRTVNRYLDALTGLFMIRQLQPWHQNLKKRQVKSPKVYVRDSGLLHALLGIKTELELQAHPKLGASWEGYVIEEILKQVMPDEAFFWATHQGAELDLLLIKDGKKSGYEIKRQDAPRLTTSMTIALNDLELDHLTVVYPGDRPYPLGPNVTVFPFTRLISRLSGAESPG